MPVVPRRASFVVFLSVLFAILAAGPTHAADDTTNIRITDRNVKAALDGALSQSETLRELVSQIAASPVRVYMECDHYLPSAHSARLKLVTASGGLRYIHVALRCRQPARLLLAMIAHELQHALEIAVNPAIIDSDSMEAYYDEIGFDTNRGGTHRMYETDEAMEAQRRVHRELGR